MSNSPPPTPPPPASFSRKHESSPAIYRKAKTSSNSPRPVSRHHVCRVRAGLTSARHRPESDRHTTVQRVLLSRTPLQADIARTRLPHSLRAPWRQRHVPRLMCSRAGSEVPRKGPRENSQAAFRGFVGVGRRSGDAMGRPRRVESQKALVCS
ncbi:hypothetical protein N658DRAFT_252486 [Parathielavia hyrcaniae]|uniref:Uncharacterized protein n=1 Tax=Parathielavia hyrcaniae TaxID=113614 RepID=A0AAN6PU89_9PEZI|nr:hypothetical protein N658DRAFT_252486 [Parathielavia hyrcaniae]